MGSSSLAAASDPYVVLGAEGQVVLCSPDLGAHLGVPRAEVGARLWDLAPALAGGPFGAAVRAVVAEQRPRRLVTRLRPGGPWIEVVALPTGAGAAVSLAPAPVPDPVHAVVLEQIDDAVIAVDDARHVLYLNPAAERMYGVRIEEALDRPLREMYEYRWLSPDDEAASARALEAHGAWRGENLHVRRDGAVLHVDSVVSLLRDEGGEAAGLLAVIRDVTEQRRAEATLRASERRFRALAAHAPVGIFLTDPRGDCVFVNARWEALAGFGAAEASGQGWALALHPDDRERVAAEWYAAVRERRPFASEYRFRRPDGRVSWVQGGAVELRSDAGELLGHIGTLSDITERHAADRALREADRRKDEFLATLAHELRNPLAPIRHGLELLRRGPDERDRRLVLETMTRQLALLVRLVDDLLDVSRISRGVVPLSRGPVSVADVLASAIETTRPALDAARHELRYDPGPPALVDGDPARLAQVFSNLLHNAAKYTPPGGRIELGVERDGAEVVVRVRDDGEGIPPEMLDRVFTMFTQLERPGARSPAGLGIGLSIVERLVRMHGGTVRACSRGPGHGSEFVVRLPALEGA